MKLKMLTEKQVQKKLQSLPDWVANKKCTEIHKVFSFQSFIEGLSFVAKVTVHAELMNHHPTVLLSYSQVKVTLTTHDVKGLTTNDFELATRIEKLSR